MRRPATAPALSETFLPHRTRGRGGEVRPAGRVWLRKRWGHLVCSIKTILFQRAVAATSWAPGEAAARRLGSVVMTTAEDEPVTAADE
jgi:hypothetical protein